MRVYIDYDSVLNNMCHAWIEWLNKTYHTNYHLRDVTSWDWFRELDVNAFKWFHDGLAFKLIRPLPDSKKFIKKMSKWFGAEILTASSPTMVSYKDKHIQKYYGKLDVIHHREKHEFVTRDVLCVLVDDSPIQCENWVSAGGIAILFNYQDEYNYSRDVVHHDRLFKATSYVEVENLLHELGRIYDSSI